MASIDPAKEHPLLLRLPKVKEPLLVERTLITFPCRTLPIKLEGRLGPTLWGKDFSWNSPVKMQLVFVYRSDFRILMMPVCRGPNGDYEAQ